MWGSKLLCTCGHSFRKNRWHKNKGMPWSYGYQCYNQLNNGSASQRRKAGADDTGYCDQSMIADWKLEMMAKMIFEQIWQERKETVDTVCELIKECYQVEKPKKVNLTGIVAQIERYKNKKNTLLEMRTDGEISKEEYKEQKEKVEKALLELTEEYERMLATEDAIQNPDICWDEIQSSLNAMIDFSNPQIERHIIRKFVSKIVPNGRNHFRWYMNLDGKDTTTIDMVTEGRKSNAVISFNDDEEDEPPLHIGDVIGLTELQQFFPNLLKNENQNGIISNVAKCGEKSSLDAILHRLLSARRPDPRRSRAWDDRSMTNPGHTGFQLCARGLHFHMFDRPCLAAYNDSKLIARSIINCATGGSGYARDEKEMFSSIYAGHGQSG